MTYSSSFRDSTEEEIKFFKIPFEDAEEDSSLESSGKFQVLTHKYIFNLQCFKQFAKSFQFIFPYFQRSITSN